MQSVRLWNCFLSL